MRGQVRFEIKRLVAPKPEAVFAVVSDILRWPLTIRSVQSIELLTPGPLEKGTRFRETRTLFGRTTTQDMEIADFEPPRRLRIIPYDPDLRYELDHIIDALGGGSRLLMVFRSRPQTIAGKGLLPLMSPFLEIRLRDELEQDMDDLTAAVGALAS
jgi:hypothetical protein